ncbi:hypothetical protein [Chachezhania sediminis]|uniref:hypothetical protein n=1 Tax=Chachezhania sediminis TaxID=2599291 RepID=UPI00131D4FC9|nr:hypothetical protein [Chachezhania sediminis]
MGALLTVPSGLDIESVADGYEADISANLVYANFFNASAKLKRNLVDGGSLATVVGAPPVAGEFAEVGQSNYINTNIPSPAGDFTLILAAKPTDNDQTGWHISSRNAAEETGIWLYRADFAPDRLTAGAYTDNGGVIASDTLVGPTGVLTEGVPFCAALRYNATTRVRRLTMLTAGSETTDTLAYAMPVSADNLLIGRSIDGTSSGGTGVAAAFIYDAELDDTDLATQYAQIKAAMAVVGITV